MCMCLRVSIWVLVDIGMWVLLDVSIWVLVCKYVGVGGCVYVWYVGMCGGGTDMWVGVCCILIVYKVCILRFQINCHK